MANPLSRRAFLASSAQLARHSFVALTLPMILTGCERAQQAVSRGAAFTTLGADEATEFAAIAARIIPSDETPWATEAGVIHFIDHVLGDNRAEELALLRTGLGELRATALQRFNGSNFSSLDAAQQDELLRAIETTPLFGTLRFLTVAGMFALPEYGGRGDQPGYRLVGLENQHVWQPPFGFYDADYAARGE